MDLPRFASLAHFRAWCKWHAPAGWMQNVPRQASTDCACRIIFRNIGFRPVARTEIKQTVLDELAGYIHQHFMGAAA